MSGGWDGWTSSSLSHHSFQASYIIQLLLTWFMFTNQQCVNDKWQQLPSLTHTYPVVLFLKDSIFWAFDDVLRGSGVAFEHDLDGLKMDSFSIISFRVLILFSSEDMTGASLE